MRRWLLPAVTALALGLLLGAPGGALATGPTVIGFDDLATSASVGDQYAVDGVRFGFASDFGATLTGISDCGPPHVVADASASSSPDVAQATRCDRPTVGVAPGTVAAFSFPRRTISVKISSGALAQAATARMVAYDAAGSVVASTSAPLVNLRATLSISRPSADVAFAAIEFDAPTDTNTPLFLDDLTLDNAAAPLTATATPFDATAGTPFTGEVGRLQDADPTAVAADFTGSIAWGDGATSPAAIAGVGSGVFTVSASHTFTTAGSYAPVLTVTKSNGRAATAQGTVDVAAAAVPPPVLGAPPVATFVVSQPHPGRIAVDASASALVAGSVASYAWHVDGRTDPQHSALCGGDASQLSTRLAAGTHTLTLNVTGTTGSTSTTTARVVVPRSHAAGRTAHTAAAAALQQVFICTPGAQDKPGDITAQGGPPSGCATEVQFGLVDAVGCLDPITAGGQWPAAENKLMQHLVSSTSIQGCAICAAGARANPAQQLPAIQTGIVAQQDPFVSRKPVRINGIDFVPHGGAAIVLMPQQNYVISSNAAIRLGGVTLTDGPIVFYVPQLSHGTATSVHIDDYTLSDQAKRIGVGGLPFDGSIGLNLVYHRAQLPVHVSLPNVFTLGDGDPVEANVTLSTDNTGGFKLDGLDIKVPEVFLGVLEVDNLFFHYTRDGDVWSGGADLVFPGAGLTLKATPPPPDNGFGMKGGEFDHAGANLSFDPPEYPTGLETFPGLFLKHIGFTIGLNPTRFSGQVGVNVVGIADVDGSMVLAFPSSRSPYEMPADAGAGLEPLAHRVLTSPSVAVGGNVALATPVGDISVGNAYLLYTFPDYVEFAGGFTYDLADVFSVEGHVKGFAQPSRRQFNIEGGMHACIAVLGCSGVDAAVSSEGIAACWSQSFALFSIQIGVGDHWGHFPDIYFFDCDVGPYEAHATRAAAAQAGAPESFTLPAGLPSTNLRIRGQGDAPRVTITGPHGERFAMPPDQDKAADANFAVVRQASTDTTFIGLRKPSAGVWTVTPDPGSAVVTEFAHAAGLPAPSIHGTVRRSGAARVLTYTSVAQPGQRITFAERGASTWRVLGVAAAGHGRLRFTPAPGPAGRREIVALVTHDGLVTSQHVVVAFRVGPPARLAAPRLHVRRHGSRVSVTWAAVSGAVRYAVTFGVSDGTRRLVLTRRSRRSASSPVSRTLAVHVRVAALSAANDPGRSSTETLVRAARPLRRRLPALRG